MKTWFGALVFLGCFARVGATPDHQVRVRERLLGTGADGFAILRVVEDNMCSYYASNEKQFLDIHPKRDRRTPEADAAEVVSTLLLDRTFTKSAVAGASDLPVVKVNSMADGEELSLSALLLDYSQMPVKWDEEKFRRLRAAPRNGVSFESYYMIWGGWVTQRFGVDRNSELEWTLESAAEDSDSMFLTVVTESQSRVVYIPRDTTQQVGARAFMADYYFVAGSFDTEAKAIDLARQVNERRKELKSFDFEPEVWSTRLRTDKLKYLVVSPMKRKLVENDSFSKLEERLGLDLEVRSSSDFQERVFFK